MKGATLAVVVAFLAALQPGPAWAPFVEETYEDYASTIRSREAFIALANKLDPVEAVRAGDFAALWVHVFPCGGDQRGIDTHVGSSAGFMLNANPKVPLQAAVLQTVAALWIQHSGRTTPYTCRYAAERVKQAVQNNRYR